MRTWAIQKLSLGGIESPHLNADELLAHCLGVAKEDVWKGAQPQNEAAQGLFRSLVGRRLRKEPLQYILGHWGFWSLDLKVSQDVMVPRPETECLVEIAVKIARAYGESHIRILDIGTGSGNIALAVASELPLSLVTATDISPRALKVARGNTQRYGCEERIELLQGDLFNPVGGRSFDIILSNPPYIPSADIEGLEPEVRDFEPRLALDGGEDGMEFHRKIIAGAGRHLLPGGWLLMETGEGQQAEEVGGIISQEGGFEKMRIVNDLHGIPRVVLASHR